MERILQRDSLHKPMVTSLQTGGMENTTKKYNNYPNKTRWIRDEEHKRNNEVLLDCLFQEDNTEENQYQKQIRKTLEEPIKTIDDIEFSREEIKQAIESFNDKKITGN